MQTVDILTTDYETLERVLNDALSSHGSRWEIFFEQIQASALLADGDEWDTQLRHAIEKIAMLGDNIEHSSQASHEIQRHFQALLADLDGRLSQRQYLKSRDLRRAGHGPQLGDGLWDGVFRTNDADIPS